MKRLDYRLDGALFKSAFPDKRISDRDELLLILMETLRYIKYADQLDINDRHTPKLVVYIDDMQRLFFFNDNKYYSLAIPFSIIVNNDELIYKFNGIEVDSLILSNIIQLLKEGICKYDKAFDFFGSVYELEETNPVIWYIFKHLLIYDMGYIRYEHDRDGHLEAIRRGTPHRHPLHHIDINISNEATFKEGLNEKLQNDDFIRLLDNKQDRSYITQDY